jgi:hypothetical protein
MQYPQIAQIGADCGRSALKTEKLMTEKLELQTAHFSVMNFSVSYFSGSGREAGVCSFAMASRGAATQAASSNNKRATDDTDGTDQKVPGQRRV